MVPWLMHPVFFEIFGRPIYWYGVLTAVGFLAAVVHWTLLGRREGRPQGLGSELGIWVMVGGILGGRVLYVLTNLSEYANPLEMLRIDKGGLVWYGGFIGGVLAIVLLARLRKERFPPFADFVITGVPLGHAFGRFGCFMNGCCYGQPSEVPWAIAINGVPCHPAPLYAVGCNLLIFAAMLFYYHRPNRRPGTVVALYLILYPLTRFSLQGIRGDYPDLWLGLDAAQLISIGLMSIGALLWISLPRTPMTNDE